MSEYIYKPESLLCCDFETRRVYIKRHTYDGSWAADTYFSVPAYINRGKRRLRGFVSKGHGGKLVFYSRALLEPETADGKRDAAVSVRTQFWYCRRPETTRAQRLGAMARAASHGMTSQEIFETFGRV